MFLKRVFGFLAIAFLCVDLLILAMYIQTKNNKLVLSDKMIENAVSYYNSNGIELDTDAIESKIPENPIYTFSESNYDVAENASQEIASKMLSSADISFVETPDGIVYSFSDKEQSVAVFKVYTHGLTFEYSLAGFETINEQIPDLKFDSDKEQAFALSSDIKKQISQFVSCVTRNSSCKYTVLGSLEEGDGVYVYIARNVYDAYLIEDTNMVLYFEDNDLKFASGNWIFPEIKKSYFEPLCDGLNALKKLDEAYLKKIISQKITYVYRSSGNETGYLIPVWKIEYIDISGNQNIQYIDAIKD